MIVYKYRDWSNVSHRNLLIYNELYLASPSDFNDPFDCRIYPNFTNLNESEIEEYIERLKKTISNEAQLEKLSIIKQTLKNDPSSHQEKHNQIHFEEQNKHYGIISLSKRWNSILMWAHYANCHKGYCVGFYEEKLRNSGLFGTGGEISYDNKYPELKPTKDYYSNMANSFKETHTKACDWHYEEEYRLTKLFHPNAPQPFERIINIPNDFFAEIVLGINISDKHREEILEISRIKKIPIYITKPKSFEFKIERELINNYA